MISQMYSIFFIPCCNSISAALTDISKHSYHPPPPRPPPTSLCLLPSPSSGQCRYLARHQYAVPFVTGCIDARSSGAANTVDARYLRTAPSRRHRSRWTGKLRPAGLMQTITVGHAMNGRRPLLEFRRTYIACLPASLGWLG